MSRNDAPQKLVMREVEQGGDEASLPIQIQELCPGWFTRAWKFGYYTHREPTYSEGHYNCRPCDPDREGYIAFDFQYANNPLGWDVEPLEFENVGISVCPPAIPLATCVKFVKSASELFWAIGILSGLIVGLFFMIKLMCCSTRRRLRSTISHVMNRNNNQLNDDDLIDEIMTESGLGNLVDD
jgi:hypothetical protein